jgi:hypothetical protein
MICSKSSELDNELTLLSAKCERLAECCKKLWGYSISFAPSRIHVQPDKHPITALEKALAKKLEDSLNELENLHNALSMRQINANKH